MTKKLPGMYESGQNVYTSKEIKGWFDYSVKTGIPANTLGKIVGLVFVGKDLNSVLYEVDFDKEFGLVNLRHDELKLG